jgi:4-amino-4-deoxy-L-arabinose transferase-like glycosyltransferase
MALVILAGALLFSICVRWRLREFPLERDEGGYAYMAQLLLHGIPPYQVAYNDKLPGLYLAYAALMAVFGQTTTGIHLGLLAVNLATIVLVFLLARDLFDSLAGGIAAASYSLLALSPSVLGMAAHATHFINFFGVAAIWALWRALQSDKLRLLLASGLLFGMAFLMKQQGAFLGGFGALVVLMHYARRRPFCWRKFLAGTTVFTLGGILPYAATCFWLWRAGVFDRFWFWTVVYSRCLAGQIPLELGAQLFWQSFVAIASANWPLEIAALLGALLVGLAKKTDNVRWFLFGYFAFSCASICPGYYFRPHYFILLLPAVAIFNGVAGSWMMDWARRPVTNEASPGSRRGSFTWPMAVLMMIAGAFVIGQQWDLFFVCTPAEACRQSYAAEPFVESCVIASYLNRHSTPEQRVAVWGSEPELYFYARRRAATGHIYTYPLFERHPFAMMLQKELCREIEAAKPEFFIMVHMPKSLWMAESIVDSSTVAWLDRYVST